jgi:hypothetical protein
MDVAESAEPHPRAMMVAEPPLEYIACITLYIFLHILLIFKYLW